MGHEIHVCSHLIYASVTLQVMNSYVKSVQLVRQQFAYNSYWHGERLRVLDVNINITRTSLGRARVSLLLWINAYPGRLLNVMLTIIWASSYRKITKRMLKDRPCGMRFSFDMTSALQIISPWCHIKHHHFLPHFQNHERMSLHFQ